MKEFNVKPGWKRRIFAALLVVIAICSMIRGPLSARFFAGATLLYAYEIAFVASPPLNKTLGEVYAMARQGWRMPWSSKILGAAAFILLVTSIYLEFQGR